MYQLSAKKKNEPEGIIQTNLKIGQTGDKFEQEADATADRVMRTSAGDRIQMQQDSIQGIMSPNLTEGTTISGINESSSNSELIQCTFQGTSRYSDPQPSPDGLVARIYFPTSETTLDEQDLAVLAQVVDHYRILLLGNSIHFDVVGTADWRPADNDRLANERAESVRQYLDNAFLRNSSGYSCSSSGIGTIGTPNDGSTAEELSEFRRADIITLFRHRRREPEPTPEPDPPEPVLSTNFKARVVGSAGGGVVIGVGFGGLEIVDTTNNRRLYYRYAGLGVSAGLSGASGISDWIEFNTSVPIRVEDFEGPVFHTAGGAALGRGPMVETFRIFGPTIPGADVVLLEYVGIWEEGWALGAGVDFGPLDPIADVDEVSEDYN
jgi:outer membrane protein OmpA-like peptidoglycan-associated protein